MNSKQVVAAVSLAMLLTILIYPTLSSGTVTVTIKYSKTVSNADHAYVSLKAVWAHQNGQSDSQGWKLLSNTSKLLDLATAQGSTIEIVGKLPAGRYDSVRVDLANATWVAGGTITQLQLESSQMNSKIDFTMTASKGLNLTLTIGGSQETLQGQKYLSATLKVALTENS